MIWTLHYLVIFLPCVYSLDDDLTTDNLFKLYSDSELEPGGVTTEHSPAITDRESLLEEEGSLNISDIQLENGTEGVLNPIYSIFESQDNITELDNYDVEILRFGEVLTPTY